MEQYKWKTNNLPRPTNKINLYCSVMNSLGLLPPPLNKISNVFKKLIINPLTTNDIDFNYGCNILFGNLKGGRALLSNAYILDYAPVIFGKNVLIGKNCQIITSWHDENDIDIVYAKPIVFGDNVWLTTDIIVLAKLKLDQIR